MDAWDLCEGACIDFGWRRDLFHAAREEHGIRAAMLARYRMDLSKPDNLEKENLGGAGDETFR